MNVYTSDKVRNIVLMGHGGVGKTTIAEAMLFASGAISRQGKVADGKTVSDFDPEEIKRKFSVNTSLIPIEWKDCKINVLDTPGYFDFVGEVQQALSVADAAVIVVDGKAGVEVGTELAWEKVSEAGLPCFFFVNGMDDPEANIDRVLEQLKDKFGSSIAPLQVPIVEKGQFVGFVDIPTMTGRKFEGNKVVDCAIPESMSDEIASVHQSLMEDAIANVSEELMERILLDDEISQEELMDALLEGTMNNLVVPVLCGIAPLGTGISVLLDSITKYFPSPVKANANSVGFDFEGNKKGIPCADGEAASAFVFKTLIDPNMGKINFFKVKSGVIRADSYTNTVKGGDERISKLYVMRGKEQIEVSEIHSGDIGATAKLSNTGTGDTLAVKGLDIRYAPGTFDEPLLCMAVSPLNKGEEDKVAQGLNRIMEEDPTIKVMVDAEMSQQLVYGIGDQHLDVVSSKLLNKFKTSIVLSKPKVSYRETIRGTVTVQGKHKKQSGGHGQYGDVHIRFEPSGENTPYVFAEEVFGGSVPKNYFPAVEKGIAECVQHGVLAGCPMVGLKATLTDGSYHPVDSSEMAFKIATGLAFKEGIPKANPAILEPIMSAHVTVDGDYVGDVMSDMNKRRGRVLGMEHVGKKTVLEAEVPMAEMFSYPTDLRSMTQGRGKFTMEFVRYEDTPRDVMEKIMAEAKKAAEEEK